QTRNVCPELRELVVTNRVEIGAYPPQYTGVPAPLVVDRAKPGIVLIVHYGQQAFHELTVCPHKILACGFFSFGARNAAAVFRFHMRLRVAPVRVGCGSPGTVPGVRWPNLAAPIHLLLSSIIQPKCNQSATAQVPINFRQLCSSV